MTRRIFIQALATLVSWVFMRPTVHADAINGSYKPAEPPISGDQRKIRLYDDYDGTRRLVLLTFASGPTHRRIVLAHPGYPGTTAPTIFILRAEIHQGRTLIEQYYDYVSGPKWWDKHILSDVDNDGGTALAQVRP